MATFQVEKTTFSGQKASQFDNPIMTDRKGDITGIVLTVPLFGEKNSFLQARIPKDAVRELIESVKSKKESEREGFIRDWIKKNQLAIYDQYVKMGTRSKISRFEYDSGMALTKIAGLTPKPVKGEDPFEATIRRTEPPPTVFKAKAQETREAKLEPPPISRTPPALARAEVQKRPIEPPIVATMPKPRIAEKPQAGPEEKKPQYVASIASAPAERRVTPIAPKEEKIVIPPLPKSVHGGDGSSKRPFIVSVSGNKTADKVGAQEMEAPLLLKIQVENSEPLLIHILTDISLSQLKGKAREDTENQLFQTCQAIILNYAAKSRKDVSPKTILTTRGQIQIALTKAANVAMDSVPNATAYLKK